MRDTVNLGKTETQRQYVITVVKIQVLILPRGKKNDPSAGYKECVYLVHFCVQILKEAKYVY